MPKNPKSKKPAVNLETNKEEKAKAANVSDKYMDVIKKSLIDFNKFSSEQRIDLYGDAKFLDQFRMHFKQKNPDLLGMLNKDDLPAYLVALEAKGFSIKHIIDHTGSLHEDFGPEETERHVMEKSLSKFKKFCDDEINNIPVGTFEKFAKEAGFDLENYNIDNDGKLKTIDDLYVVWKKFAEKEDIKLKEFQTENIEKILNPDYNPIERIMVSVLISKIKKELPKTLKEAFEEVFDEEICIFSPVKDLNSFKSAWIDFLNLNASQIDEKLAKKLDNIIVTNGDIKNRLWASGRKFDEAKGFGEWETNFKIIYNKLAARSLFEEIKLTQNTIDMYADTIVETMRGFPPYVNEIFKMYPYNIKDVEANDASLNAALSKIDDQIHEAEKNIADEKHPHDFWFAEKDRLQQQKEKIRRDAYVKFLATKDKKLASIISILVDNKFNFAKLNHTQQQEIINFLVKNKLEDLIKNKAPELMGMREDDLLRFVDDLFDLDKMNVDVPTAGGPVRIKFKKKEFMSNPLDKLISIEEISNLQNLPLNFEIDPTPTSEDFFEKSIIFDSIFNDFDASNGKKRLNEAYKVKLTKDGKSVEGYLSQYSPIGEKNLEKLQKAESGKQEADGGERYLYTSPVSAVNEDRDLVTRENDDPVVIKKENEKDYHIDVLKKDINLNGEAIGALMWGFVLGQQSMEKVIDSATEKALAAKIGKLNTYKDINQQLVASSKSQVSSEGGAATEKKEKTEKDKFLDEWKRFPGYKFEGKEYAKDGGFRKGTRFVVKTGETALPPFETKGDAWMTLEIVDVNYKSGTFTIKSTGGELPFSSDLEGKKKVMPISTASLQSMKDVFGDDIFVMPDPKEKGVDGSLDAIKSSGIDVNFKNSFDKIRWADNGFKFELGDFAGEKVEYFGFDSPQFGVGVTGHTETKMITSCYKVKYNSNGTVTVTNDDFLDKDGNSFPYKKEMDYDMFLLFVAGKKLVPKADKEIEKGKEAKGAKQDQIFDKTKTMFSINNILGFFKGGFNKIVDSVKKYDEERTEDLTDTILQNGELFTKIGKGIGGVFTRVGESMEKAGMEYYVDRDSRVWKKIEKRQKIYENDKHYTSFYGDFFDKVLKKGERPTDRFKIPAMLLTIIKKEKTPYARNFDLIGKGHRINLILGKRHQDRYIDILNKKTKEMQQNADLYGIDRTVYKREEIVKLEMKYITDVIDGREHGVFGATKPETEEYAWAKIWSRTFACNLDDSMKENFGFNTINQRYEKTDKNTSFEFAEYEYNRHLRNNKPGQAFPFLKIMARQAQNSAHWKIFQMHITAGILSGVYDKCLDATTEGWIKDICRTKGFLPGLRAKHVDQQTRMLKMLDIYSKGGFSKIKVASGDFKGKAFGDVFTSFRMGSMDKLGNFVFRDFKKWRLKDPEGSKFVDGFFDFLQFNGKNVEGKKLVDLWSDPKTPNDEKTLLNDYIKLGEQKSDDIDAEIKRNPEALSNSPFTKCETVTRSLMKYSEGEFEGKDSHEKEGPAAFRSAVAREFPKGKLTLSEVRFYMSKFMNRFGALGFDGDEKTIFVRRLKTAEKLLSIEGDEESKKSAEDILRYTINGTILQNAGGRGTTPESFKKGINAFKEFFKSNLDKVLEKDMVADVIGPNFVDDSQKPYRVGSWAEYVELSDPAAMMGLLDPKIKAEKSKQRQRYRSDEYINENLYRLAERLQTSHSETNRFKKYYDPTTAKFKNMSSTGDTAGELHSNLENRVTHKGVKIKNPKTIKKIEDILKGKVPGKGDESDEEAMMYENY